MLGQFANYQDTEFGFLQYNFPRAFFLNPSSKPFTCNFLGSDININSRLKLPYRTKQLREERHAEKNARQGVRKEMQKMLLMRRRERRKGKNGAKSETQEKVG